MKWLGILLVAIALALAGCAANPQQPSAPTTGGNLPQAAPPDNTSILANISLTLPMQVIPPQIKPDLRLNAIEFNTSAALNMATEGTVTVYNLGALPNPPAKVAYYIDGELAGAADLSAIPPGQTGTASISFTCSKAGNHTLRVDVDYENLGNETDRRNNAGSKDFECS